MTDFEVVQVVTVDFSPSVALREDSNYVSPNSKYQAIRELEVGVLQLWHFHKLTLQCYYLGGALAEMPFRNPSKWHFNKKSLQSGFAIWICKTRSRDEEGQ